MQATVTEPGDGITNETHARTVLRVAPICMTPYTRSWEGDRTSALAPTVSHGRTFSRACCTLAGVGRVSKQSGCALAGIVQSAICEAD